MSTDFIPIGLMAPITGIAALHGPSIVLGAQLACDEINGGGGVLGRALKLVIEDDGSMPDTAVPAARRLIDQHRCVALIGTLMSNSRIAISAQVSEPLRIPYLNFAFYEGSIRGRYFFNFGALPNQQIDCIIPYLAEKFGDKMFFAGSDYEWPRGSIAAARHALTTIGGEAMGEEYLPIGSGRIDQMLERLQRSGANVFVSYFTGDEQIQVLERMAALELQDQFTTFAGHCDEALVQRLAPALRDGLYAVNSYFMAVDTPENKLLLDRIASRAAQARADTPLTTCGEAAYLCVKAFALAAEQAGSVAADDLASTLKQIELYAPQGRVRMDKHTQHAHLNTYLARCNAHGRFDIVASFGLRAPSIPERYRSTGPSDKNDGSMDDGAGHPTADAGTTATVLLSRTGNVLGLSRAALKLWQPLDPDYLIGREIENLLSDASTAVLRKAMQSNEAWQGTLEARLPNAGACVVTASLEPLVYRQGRDTWSLLLAPLDAGILAQNQHLLSLAGLAMVSTDSKGIIVHASASACAMFGYEARELIGSSVHLLLPPSLRARHGEHLGHFAANPALSIPMSKRDELSGYRKDGSTFPLQVTISKFKLGDEWVLVAMIHDISERKLAEDELIRRATHDPLTELANRGLIMARLDNALVRSRRSDQPLALLFIDLDGFKLVNDAHGHGMGDALLKQIAGRILKQTRPGDTLGRLAADEFLLLCEQVDDPVTISSLADRLIDAIRKPVHIGNIELRISASIGIALSHERALDATALLREADLAMSAVKARGRNGWQFFNDALQQQADLRGSINTGLKTALEKSEFSLLCQPILSTEDERIAGAELLLRWHRATGPVSPADFIPIAESNGTIHDIGEWVFGEACRLESGWRARFGETAPYVSVNLSTRQLDDPQLPAKFARLIALYDADPARIILEVTETSLMSDVAHCLMILQELATLGLRCAVDDFGTGYSSLTQLLRLPIDTLKVDREFVDGLHKRPDSRAITAAVIKLGHALQLKIIAEGVENQEEMSELKVLGCDFVQGYHLHRPMSQQSFLEVVHAQRCAHSRFFDRTIHYLIYVSKGRTRFDDASLKTLLTQCRPINQANAVTGLLLTQGDHFMQIMEGREEDVQRTFDRIRNDPRHENIRVVARGYKQTRMFPQWEMGHRPLGPDSLPQSSRPQSASSRIMPHVHFMDLANDPRACFTFICAYADDLTA